MRRCVRPAMRATQPPRLPATPIARRAAAFPLFSGVEPWLWNMRRAAFVASAVPFSRPAVGAFGHYALSCHGRYRLAVRRVSHIPPRSTVRRTVVRLSSHWFPPPSSSASAPVAPSAARKTQAEQRQLRRARTICCMLLFFEWCVPRSFPRQRRHSTCSRRFEPEEYATRPGVCHNGRCAMP